MQNSSAAYKKSMKSGIRNRGYIRVTIGVINSEAQKNVTAKDSRNNFTYFSNPQKPFDGYTVDKVYATAEQNLSKVNGSMYFLPVNNPSTEFYNNGIVTGELLGSVYIGFSGVVGLDIKGLTIDFGESYPTDFTIENNGITRSYKGNNKRLFVTEDVFSNTSYLIITPTAMINGQDRLRIFQFSCGIVNSFTNQEVLKYTSKEYVSSITDSIPSNDTTITVDNRNLYYSPDNPSSTIAFMEVGQEVKTEFGYDVSGNGDVEWLPPSTTYLKSWNATDSQAKFTATDRFDYLTGTYYKGTYQENGISLYDLAIDVLHDAGIIDDREYFVDPYLKNVMVYNPIPVVKHSEALQIIANAGRCVLYEDRQSRIHIKSSFIPDMEIRSNGETEYSNVNNVLDKNEKSAYAIESNDFSIVDNTLLFMPDNGTLLNTGYISNKISDRNGNFQDNPVITINLEAGYVAYGLKILFRNVAPQEFVIRTYYNNVSVGTFMETIVDFKDTVFITSNQFDLFDKMEIEFTKAHPNSRITIDNILFGDVTDYTITRNHDLLSTPTATRKNKIKSISVLMNKYANASEQTDIQHETILLTPNNNKQTVYFSNPTYGLSVQVDNDTRITATVIESSSFYAVIEFNGLSRETSVEYTLKGYEYIVGISKNISNYNAFGEEISWNNPLVSEMQHAQDIIEWLSSYYLGDVEYQIKWRGDPRTDANDLFYLELKDRETTMVRSYQNELSFSGAWSGTMKARKAVI